MGSEGSSTTMAASLRASPPGGATMVSNDPLREPGQNHRANLEAPPASESGRRRRQGAGLLEVIMGSEFCQLTGSERPGHQTCVTDGAGPYGNDEACTVRFGASGTVTATEFDTESGYDFVDVAGVRYDGRVGPQAVAVSVPLAPNRTVQASLLPYGPAPSVTQA